ncbi:unnamed protein product [Adineta steineri]|uniref:Uncharacterized protein n=1 Tax=Adineta steineri TaxID=433720 RepID=A0A813PB56_9BILA|nr:unnamed protein product [Adineta steineri]CAF3755326.1 unnamed protein product [Adineta steineri]
MVLMDGDISRCKLVLMPLDLMQYHRMELEVVERWWNSAIQSGGKVVIPLPTGWDPRPRFEHPVPLG